MKNNKEKKVHCDGCNKKYYFKQLKKINTNPLDHTRLCQKCRYKEQ